ncbi:ABC transporter ATP-binding protein [Microbacterium sp. No. 7]|uniref:ABC transporter ATP-binding protein n=1 Tax=Microbacterium sp. No. 7 TaxID=1714373 RepID=UPI0006CF6D95|nr:ABC transporter ATP-binding protein [Microbacterium sp. No. 7]ALJ21573.1 iron-dicitrate transporter ATP-binding subunit [Microbacterium sp. No. 7]
MTSAPALHAQSVTLSYDARQVAEDLTVEIPEGGVTVIIGPNACGKSTLLRALSRLLAPKSGHVLLHGEDVRRLAPKELARRLGLLPQSSVAPFGITVADLVGRGRFPHQRMLQQWSLDDEAAVQRAMAATGIAELADRAVDELSGGQRQRVWIAMLLAQDTPVMLLDEPTTYLDIAHQLDVLELCRRLNREEARTMVLVLHDLNQAARYADHLVVLKDGALAAAGRPVDVLTEDLLHEVFGLTARVLTDPVLGTPLVIPIASSR